MVGRSKGEARAVRSIGFALCAGLLFPAAIGCPTDVSPPVPADRDIDSDGDGHVDELDCAPEDRDARGRGSKS